MTGHPRDVAAFEAGTNAAAQGDPPPDAVLASITASYFYLRRGLGVAAFAFPIVLWLGADPSHLQPSISAYYHYSPTGIAYGGGAMRDVFVGVLWAVGLALFFYKGYSAKEDWALNVAGIAAAGIACFPMDWPTGVGSWTDRVHYTSAATFFLATGFVCLFCAGDTLVALRDAEKARRFQRVYRLLGIAMVAVPLAVLALHLLFERSGESHVTLAIEVAGMWIFASFWLVKSREIALIERQAPLAGIAARPAADSQPRPGL
ncbi:MAG: putative rane protein [Alphaproteobacteria bacterium]|nr:putative rane protein [Alphaproteobacteria bacterium]